MSLPEGRGAREKRLRIARLRSRIDALNDRRVQLETEFTDEYAELRGEWNLKIGPLHISRRLSSMTITWIFLFFLAGCIGAGVTLMTVGVATALGVSLVAGSILGLGTFVGQVWSLTVQSERSVRHEVFEKALAERLVSLLSDIESLHQELDTAESSLERLTEADEQNTQ